MKNSSSSKKAKNLWTKERCLIDALKYTSNYDWQKNSKSAYNAAYRNGWNLECCAHMSVVRGKWTKETCPKDALKYNTISEWTKNSSGATDAARKHGWFDDCCRHMSYGKKSKWTKEACYMDAQKYSTRSAWKHSGGSGYSVAVKSKWLDYCCGHMRVAKKWTKEECIQDALRFPSRKDWQINSKQAFYAAQKNKWQKDCFSHMPPVPRKKKKYNPSLDECVSIASKYSSLTEWCRKSPKSIKFAEDNNWVKICAANYPIKERHKTLFEICLENALTYSHFSLWKSKSYQHYECARKRKWITKCTEHMPDRPTPANFFKVKENCIAAAQKYQTFKEWRENAESSYKNARKYGWVPECTAHMKGKKQPLQRSLYILMDRTKNIAYVGLTENFKKRLREHILDKKQIRSAHKKGTLTKYISTKKYSEADAVALEADSISWCRENGFILLNKAEAGSLGGSPLRWTLEECKADAAKYSTKRSWLKNSSGAHHAASRRGWLDKCCAHMVSVQKPTGYWTKERCMEDAKKYRSRSQWAKESSGAASAAHKGGWHKECCAHMKLINKPRGYWNLKNCKADAKRFSSRKEWEKQSSGAWSSAQQNGWLDKCKHKANKNSK